MLRMVNTDSVVNKIILKNLKGLLILKRVSRPPVGYARFQSTASNFQYSYSSCQYISSLNILIAHDAVTLCNVHHLLQRQGRGGVDSPESGVNAGI